MSNFLSKTPNSRYLLRSDGFNWRLIWQFGLIACVIALLFFSIRKMEWKMSGDSDKLSAEQFAGFYLATPIAKLENLRGWGTCSYSEATPTGYICFDCDQKPLLTDANLYESGGDSIALADKFLQQFGPNARTLLHSNDLVCLRMKEGAALPTRYLLHNPKTKQYFFARL